MKAKYLEKQIDASIEEIIGALNHATLYVLSDSPDGNEAREEWIDAVAHELRKLSNLFKQDSDMTDDEENEEDFNRMSAGFHGSLAEDLPFASVPLEDGGENE